LGLNATERRRLPRAKSLRFLDVICHFADAFFCASAATDFSLLVRSRRNEAALCFDMLRHASACFDIEREKPA
jgi:hypothetical protein